MSMQRMSRMIELQTEINLLTGSINKCKKYVEHLMTRYVSADDNIDKHLAVIKHCRMKRYDYQLELAKLKAVPAYEKK